MTSGGVRRSVVVSITAVLALGLVACGGTAAVSPAAATVDGLPITHFQSGLKANAPAPDLQVRNVSDDEADKIATATIADVETYWGQRLPADFGMEFEPVSSL